MHACSKRYIFADRRNQFEENVLGEKLRRYKHAMSLCRYKTDREQSELKKTITSIKRNSGVSEHGRPPNDSWDNEYNESYYGRAASRLSETRLNQWREREDEIQKFLHEHETSKMGNIQKLSRPVSAGATLVSRPKSGVTSEVSKKEKSSDYKIRPHTADLSKRKTSASLRVECPRRPSTATPKQTTPVEAFVQTDTDSYPILEWDNKVTTTNKLTTHKDIQNKPIIEFGSSFSLDNGRLPKQGVAQKVTSVVSIVSEGRNTDIDDENRSLYSKSILKYPTLNRGVSISTFRRKVLESTRIVQTFQEKLKHRSVTTALLRPDYVVNTLETVKRDASVYSKNARKLALKSMVDQNCPKLWENIISNRIKKAQTDQIKLSETTREFCHTLERDFKHHGKTPSYLCLRSF